MATKDASLDPTSGTTKLVYAYAEVSSKRPKAHLEGSEKPQPVTLHQMQVPDNYVQVKVDLTGYDEGLKNGSSDLDLNF